MAGSYPDVPGHRIAYDRDGTIGFRLDSNPPAVLTNANLRAWNDESTTRFPAVLDEANGLTYFGLLFANPYDIDGFFFAFNSDGLFTDLGAIETSTNTTTGSDGTWTSRGVPTGAQVLYTVTLDPNVSPSYREETPPGIETGFTWSAVKGIRINGASTSGTRQWRIYAWHLYGTVTGPTDRLQITDTGGTLVGPAYFDFGDITAGSTANISFKVRNLSGTLTATGVSVGIEALTDGTPPLVGMFDFSVDAGATWHASASVPDLAPGATSGTVILRRTMPGGTPVGVWAQRIVASAGAFL